jgi:multisubunit Na+/H+ antiporter MnhB subunit
MGALDYTMTQTRNAAYMGQFTPEQLDYFYGYPSWAVAGWAVGVWLALAGSLLLLLRNASSLWAFILSFAGIVVASIYSFGLAELRMTDVVGSEALIFTAAIILFALFLIWYARRMKIAGVLR